MEGRHSAAARRHVDANGSAAKFPRGGGLHCKILAVRRDRDRSAESGAAGRRRGGSPSRVPGAL